MWVYSKTFDYLYDITDATELLIDSFYIGTGHLKMILPVTHDAVYFIQKNGWIVTDDGEPFIVKVIEQGDAQVTYTAFSGHKILCQRVARQVFVAAAGTVDAVVKSFIDQLKGDLPVVTAEPDIVVSENNPDTSDQLRLTNLGDTVEDLLASAERGEEFTLAEGAGLTFDTYAGRDRSIGNAEPVIFALEYGNIDEPKYMQDSTKEQTTVYVAGKGEGDTRKLHVLGGDVTGTDRVEVVVDARDVDSEDTLTLTERASQYLIKDTITISATTIAESNLKYGTDYKLGDKCTIKVKVKSYQQSGEFYDRVESTMNVNKRLVEVTKSYKGGSLDIDLVFGAIKTSETSVTKKEVASLKAVEPTGYLSIRGGTVSGDVSITGALTAGSGTITGNATINGTLTAGGSVVRPTGEITMWPALSAPAGWLLCDGSPVSRTIYSALFGVVGTVYGGGDGTTTFNVPDLRGRFIAGYKSDDSYFNAFNKTGGEKTHILTAAEMPSHQHESPFPSNTGSSVTGNYAEVFGYGRTAAETGQIIEIYNSDANCETEGNEVHPLVSATGGGGEHNNMPPYIVLNYIIKT